MDRCYRCKAKATTQIMNGGEIYILCERDFMDFDASPDSNTKTIDFITMSKKEWIARNMKLAKEARERDEGVWKMHSLRLDT